MWADGGSEHRCVLLLVLGGPAQSPCLFSTKSFHLPLEFLENPPHASSPSLSVCAWARLSLSPLTLNILQGDEDRFVCVITPALSVRGFRQLPVETFAWLLQLNLL